MFREINLDVNGVLNLVQNSRGTFPKVLPSQAGIAVSIQTISFVLIYEVVF